MLRSVRGTRGRLPIDASCSTREDTPTLFHFIYSIRVVFVSDLIDRLAAAGAPIKFIRAIDDHSIHPTDIFITVYDAFGDDNSERLGLTDI